MISIVTASYDRPIQAKRFLRWVKESETKTPYEIVYVASGCVDTYESILAEGAEELLPIMLPRNLGWVSAINTGVAQAGHDLILAIPDDFKIEKGAVDKLLEILNDAYPEHDGIVGASDGRKNMDTYSQWSRAWLGSKEAIYKEQAGHYLWPEYIHYGADKELTLRLVRKFNYTYTPDVNIVHHPITTDLAHEEALKSKERDNIILSTRKVQGFPNRVKEVI